MELKTFIAETLVGIQDGVQMAIERTQDTKGAINPCFGGTRNAQQQLVQLVEFDLAVTFSDRGDGEGVAQIEVLTAKVGKDKKAKDGPNVSRIQFAVPILPAIQMMSADESPDPVAESLRRARKVASAAVAADSGVSKGFGGGPAPASASTPEPMSEPAHTQ
jgi:hypothetical protein